MAAFAGALLAMAAVYGLAAAAGGALDGRVLLLAGVVVGAFAGALVSGILAVSAAQGARTAMLWLMGGLGGVGWGGVLALALLRRAGPRGARRARPARSTSSRWARSRRATSAPTSARSRRRIYVAASLLTAAAVAAAGIIGFVGLVVPHAIRLLRGHDHRDAAARRLRGGRRAPGRSPTCGARTAFAPLELPVGVVTAVVGVPVFALLLRRWTARSSS